MVMYAVCEEKFKQEPFKTLLMRTGESILIEGNTWGDTYFGVCNGVGENNLGKDLMSIRGRLLEGTFWKWDIKIIIISIYQSIKRTKTNRSFISYNICCS